MLVAFVTAQTPPFDMTFNRVAAAVTGGAYCHCESAFEALELGSLRELRRQFAWTSRASTRRAESALKQILGVFPPDTPDKHPVTLAFHALAGQPLGVRVLSEFSEDPLFRPYDETWRVYRLAEVPRRVVRANLVWSLAQVGKPYDTMGALTSPLHWSHGGDVRGADPAQWFCSSLCLRFLQHMNLCSDLSLKGTTPNSLEKALRQYIPEELPRLQETTGGAAVLRWDADHWALVSSLVPFIVGAELDAPQRVLSSSGAAT